MSDVLLCLGLHIVNCKMDTGNKFLRTCFVFVFVVSYMLMRSNQS